MSALVLTTALVTPSLAYAQADQNSAPQQPPSGPELGNPAPAQPVDGVDQGDAGQGNTATADAAEEAAAPEISAPGGDIIVTGRRSRNVVKASNQVISVLSAEEIARTGEGDIAGALGRVTGLSVVGNGLVYVRGLGDRYSLALLNGSPLPSPEPLRRVVPLDIFPTGVIASSLVQKSYSVNYPGEFGGGVINLTTKAVPKESFLSIGGGGSVDTETTGDIGYSYYGSKSDWTGFDNGERDLSPELKDYFASGSQVNNDVALGRRVGATLVNARNAVVQRVRDLPPGYSVNITGGTSFEVGDATLGVIAAAGFSNKWRNREVVQQTSNSSDLALNTDFTRVNTDNHIIANGLIGLGAEFGDNKIRWTNLYIRDTVKQTRLGIGRRFVSSVTADYLQQDTAWYERQLINSQVVAELRPTPELSVDVRGGYANSQREAPNEFGFEYVRTNVGDPQTRDLFINNLNGNSGTANVAFSDLNEDLWSGGIDVSYKVTPDLSLTVGGVYSDTKRVSSRRAFTFRASSSFPAGAAVLRPDLLLQPDLVLGVNTDSSGRPTPLVGGIDLIETDTGSPKFEGKLRNYAGYGKINWQATDALSIDAGVRFEKARQSVEAVQVFSTPTALPDSPTLRKEYWLPAATITYQVQPDLQVRLSASKTIARPQFRELIYQPFFDPDSNRQYLGNPLLTDSQLYNAEARVEWYFAPDQRLSLSGFYKKIKNPIESYVFTLSDDLITSYANAPEAQLYGAEVELQKYFDLGASGGWFADRRAVVVANYTYSNSKLKVGADDQVAIYPQAAATSATDFFRDGAPLTGQSDHLVNLQLGLENTERLSQQTILLNFASNRVVSRGLNGTEPLPDVIEKPGITLDVVLREGIQVRGKEVELKFEARNLLRTRHQEYQDNGTNRIQINSYDVGRVFSLSAGITF
ncbi:outer membrane receptor protein involved in Fe transport [Novosphingobium chloroacetimidivorans]|uniref:Outer membrane receptor protein involved in Fe transport n=1 Tax=Novosphingobium chloroacetimidivorans TaxID=1428314 RepID=A0A7W7NVY2_9SPHN|nr:outer membrane receptor protein involved in Fe transport [Novosphingobium chloroacetimidivorans]